MSMKKGLMVALTSCGLCFLGFASQNGVDHWEIIKVGNITKEHLDQFIAGEYCSCVVEFTEGAIFPLRLFLNGNIFNFVDGCGIEDIQVEVKQTFYVRFDNNEFLFSADFDDWKPFQEFAMGSISIALGVDEDVRFISVIAEADVRS